MYHQRSVYSVTHIQLGSAPTENHYSSGEATASGVLAQRTRSTEVGQPHLTGA